MKPRHLLALALLAIGGARADAQGRVVPEPGAQPRRARTVPAPKTVQKKRVTPRAKTAPVKKSVPARATAAPVVVPAPPAAAAAAVPVATGPGSELSVTLITFGLGEAVWERFGHNALWLHDEKAGTDMAYNWGLFDFEQPGFLRRFLTGDTKYWSILSGGALRVQYLDLSVTSLAPFLTCEFPEESFHRQTQLLIPPCAYCLSSFLC